MSNYEVKKYPEKSWSISKMKVIQNCLREYYYTYYESHNGWLYESSDEAKSAWRLKKLTNITLVFGDKIHELIRDIVRNNWESDENKIDVYIRNKLNKVVRESIEKYKTGEWDDYPRGEMLQEYYYGEKLESDKIYEIKEKVKCCAKGFMESITYEEIKSSAKKILEVDEGKFDYIMVHGVKVYALLDLLYIDKDDNYVIVDWKTGKISEYDAEQLMVYVLYVMNKYNIPIEKIKCRVEYLLLNEYVEYKFTNEDIDIIEEKIKLDINVIDAMVVDSENNIPKPKEDFIRCDSIRKCNKCKYRKICLKGEI